MTAPATAFDYPATITVDPLAQQSRLSILVRLILAIPHSIVLYALGIAANVISIIAWFVILFTGKYPAGLYSFTLGYFRWSTRYAGYVWLLTDKYPPFALDEFPEYPVRAAVVEKLDGRNRLTTAFRFILVIPHFIVLAFLFIAANIIAIAAWVVGLIKGELPYGFHNFLGGWVRWMARVQAYTLFLTDEYPPFSLN
jgi:hypothetical protein